MGKSRIGAFLDSYIARIQGSCVPRTRVLVHKVLVVQEQKVLVTEGSCMMKNSLGGGEQVPPAVLVFEHKGHFLHKSPGGVEQVPPAFFFSKQGPFFT